MDDQDITVIATGQAEDGDEVEAVATFHVDEATAEEHTTSEITFHGEFSEYGVVRGIADDLIGSRTTLETVYQVTGRYLTPSGEPDIPATLIFLQPANSRFVLDDGRILFAGIGLKQPDGRVGRDALFIQDGIDVPSASASLVLEGDGLEVANGQD
jgi:hypothetical protein